jgi:hypothetical protein
MRRIVIQIFRHGTMDQAQYYMGSILQLLMAEGVEVKVVRGSVRHIDADLAISHVDLTTIPDDHLQFLKNYPLVLNGKVTDISKRRISRLRLNPGDAHEGPVIIKANLNCGGRPEAWLARHGWLPGRHEVVSEYRVLESIREVSDEIWNDPNLVVERFRPEQVDGVYRLRMWKFLGDAETNTIAYSRDPIVKGRTTFRREDSGTAPDALRQIRKELGFDYGKFDYGIVDGEVVLYDANRTPTISQSMSEEMPRIRAFAEALKRFGQLG